MPAKVLRIAAVPVISILIGVPAFVSAPAQAKPSTAPAAPPVQLQPYTGKPDQSASAGCACRMESVAGASQTNIVLSGAYKAEVIDLGEAFIAHDGPFSIGKDGTQRLEYVDAVLGKAY